MNACIQQTHTSTHIDKHRHQHPHVRNVEVKDKESGDEMNEADEKYVRRIRQRMRRRRRINSANMFFKKDFDPVFWQISSKL